MSQYTGNTTAVSPLSGVAAQADILGLVNHLMSQGEGGTRPANIQTGGIWTKDVGSGVYVPKFWDGASDRALVPEDRSAIRFDVGGTANAITLTSALDVIREAAHPNVRPMLDFFHFWSGLSKFDDLDLLEPGELAHAHFQDLLDTPRELINNDSRLIPGDGIAPVVRIIRKLAEKQYAGALSVELFRAEFVQGNPFQVATEIRQKCEAVMRQAQGL